MTQGQQNRGYRGQIMLVALIVIVATSLFAVAVVYEQYYTLEHTRPISTWPASWSNVCGLPGERTGNDTTNVSNIHKSYTQGLGNLALDQLHSRIIDSQSFQNYTAGEGWVTTYLGSQLISGPGYSDSYVVTIFILLQSQGRPDGYLTTYYNIANASVTSDCQTSIIANCPAMR